MNKSWPDFRIDGALRPWSDGLLGQLLEMFPLPNGSGITPADDTPSPRVLLKPVSHIILEKDQYFLETSVQHHKGIVKVNKRITAEDWYQDVRHIEIGFEDDIQSVFFGDTINEIFF